MCKLTNFWQVAIFVSGFLAVVSGCFITPLRASTTNNEELKIHIPAAFDSYQTMRVELEKMRQACKPFMRSLPAPLNIRKQVPIAEAWRFAYEVEPFGLKKEEYPKGRDIPEARKWYTKDFNDSMWEKVTVPEWRYLEAGVGDTPEPLVAASFIGWYRTSFSGPVVKKGKRVFLVFRGVDWRAQVWLNGKFLGSHITYYEPFRFDVTDILEENNVLALRVIDGPAYGEPVSYWGPLPTADSKNPRFTRDNQQEFMLSLTGRHYWPLGSGGGLLREVYLEPTGDISIDAVFARANLQQNTVKVKVETDALVSSQASIDIQIIPENFKGRSFQKIVSKKFPEGDSTEEIVLPIPDAKHWSPQSPYLYRCRVILKHGNKVIDGKDILFGCRSFSIASKQDSEKTGAIPGTFYLNSKPIFLRCANIQCLNLWWYWGQEEKLIDSLLMLKIANFNMVRACQHVNFPEVREYMDRLGIMSEQDQGYGNPRTSYRPSPKELIATARPLTRVCYNNPGVIVLSFANEVTLDTALVKEVVDEVLKVDPERIITPVSDLYETKLPQSYSKNLIRDFHTYIGWYSWHGGEKGEVWRWPEYLSKKISAHTQGNNIRLTVGEYGGEALDSFQTMKGFPPQLGTPDSPDVDVLFGHAQVQKADFKQRIGFYGKTPCNLGEYIEASQNFQALLLAEMTTMFRTSFLQQISGYMVFYYAEPLPWFWAKSIVGSDLRPKKAYYEMAQVNRPLVPLFQLQKGGNSMKVWIANNFPQQFKNCKVSWNIEAGGKSLLTGAKTSDVPASNAILVEKADLTAVPENAKIVKISLHLTDSAGKELSSYERELWLELWRKEDAILKKIGL